MCNNQLSIWRWVGQSTHGVDLVKVVHEAPSVHRVGQLWEVPADPGVEAGEVYGGGVVEARDLPIRKVATKQEVWNTRRLELCWVVEVGQIEIMFLLLTGQTRLVPLPGLPPSHHGGRDEFSQRGEINTELSGETGQS